MRVPARRDAWFSGQVPAWKRWVARGVACGNRVLDAVPVCRWLYRLQLARGLQWTATGLELREASRGWAGATAVFLSDLHAGSFLHERELDGLLAAVAERRPELVLLGGDLVHTRRREIELLTRPLRRLRDVPHVFAVPGNHERFDAADVRVTETRLGDLGVVTLRDRGVRLVRNASPLWVCGVDDLTEGAPRPAAALASRDPRETAVCLSHHPDLFGELAALGVDLVLSGHTHGGQLALWGRPLLSHSQDGHHRGAHRLGDSTLYVGRGIGASIVPLRIGARPEVVIVRFVAGATRAAAGR
ncbi:MAG: metallophosphoesterase [Planctomycetes bacterium]|nr:metallophosphoesterase [Planctomycetota bacterium]